MTDSDSRPRPQYGEYASDAEQQSHIREPARETTALVPPVIDEFDAKVASGDSRRPVMPAGIPAAQGVGRQIDRFATIALLAYGAFSVFTTVFSLFDFPAVVNRTYKIMGIEGDFTNFVQGKTWGAIAAGVLLVGFALTIALALKRIKARKLTWWFVLVCAAVTYLIVGICMSIPLSGDPAFLDSVTQNISQR